MARSASTAVIAEKPPARRGRRPRSPAAAPLAPGVVLLAVLLSAPAPPAAADPPPADVDPRAAAVADRAAAALGGAEAWDATRFISFHFAGRRAHVWDKATGRHRVEGTTRDGEPYVVLHNVVTREGRAWVGGEPAAGAQAAELLENAHAAWINDTYWLLMPYKLRDPGVVLRWDGEDEIDGVAYDRLALSFAQVGLTPGDRYWAWFNRETGLLDRWGYVLEDQPSDADPTLWLWQGWQRYGRIQLAPLRKQVGGDRTLDLAPIEVADRVPDAVFESPAPAPAAGGDPPSR
jgi:hypothetical protein